MPVTLIFRLKPLLASLITDALLGLTLFWIKDQSEEFHQTTELTILSINIIDSILLSGLINKGIDIISFFLQISI